MNDNSVIREKRRQAFWITINRPEKRYTLNAEVIAGIASGYREAHDNKDVHVMSMSVYRVPAQPVDATQALISLLGFKLQGLTWSFV